MDNILPDWVWVAKTMIGRGRASIRSIKGLKELEPARISDKLDAIAKGNST